VEVSRAFEDEAATNSGALIRSHIDMYIVRMKRVTASDARKDWFRLLDEVAGGEKVVIERRGRRILLSCETVDEDTTTIPDYGTLIQAPDADQAEQWSWSWSEEGVALIEKPPS
jgi:hypothetical protein